MDWPALMSHKRLCGEFDDPDVARTPDLRDMDRVVFSAAFRRLQDKTQVFPLPYSDYVRTRLTHSLEASCVGRSLGALVGKEIIQQRKLPSTSSLAPMNFGITVGVACLAHDIGNPPFGHSGEDAIQNWFRTSDIAKKILTQLNERQQNDFLNFEGNAQGFRILTALQNADVHGGLRLTCSTLASFTKYPRESAIPSDEKLLEIASTKKHGIAQSEMHFFEEVAETCGLKKRSGAPRCWTRHPLAFLVEAADDICYRIIDLEDGFRLKHVSFNDVEELLSAIVGDQQKRLRGIKEKQDKVAFLRSKAIDILTRQSADAFVEREAEILGGVFDTALVSHIAGGKILEEIKGKSRELVYSAPEVLGIEAAGFDVIGGLLDYLVSAATDCAERDSKATARSKKYMQLLPERCAGDDNDPYKRLLHIVDYIAGMTDSFAVSLYKKLKGMSLLAS